MYDSPAPVIPTHQRCFLRDTQDALLVLQAVLNDVLPLTQCRPTDQNRAELIKSGNVFVVDIAKGSINRWTDGLSWSPSRILGAFLLYREKKQGKRVMKRPGSISKGSKSAISPTSMSSHKRNIRKNYSSQSLNGMPQGMMVPQSVGYPEFLLDDNSRSIRSSYPPSMSDQMRGQNVEYNLYGSLTSNEQYKEDGLLKKTITIGFRESVFRIVGYYLPRDVEEKYLISPSEDETFANVHIDPELSDTKNIKMPISVNERDFGPLDPIYGMPITSVSAMRTYYPNIVNDASPHLAQQPSSKYQSSNNMPGNIACQSPHDVPFNASKNMKPETPTGVYGPKMRLLNRSNNNGGYMNGIDHSEDFIDIELYGPQPHMLDEQNGVEQYRQPFDTGYNPRMRDPNGDFCEPDSPLLAMPQNRPPVSTTQLNSPDTPQFSAYKRHSHSDMASQPWETPHRHSNLFGSDEAFPPSDTSKYQKMSTQTYKQNDPMDYNRIAHSSDYEVNDSLHLGALAKAGINPLSPNPSSTCYSPKENIEAEEQSDAQSNIIAAEGSEDNNLLSGESTRGFPASVITQDMENYDPLYSSNSPGNSTILSDIPSGGLGKGEFSCHGPSIMPQTSQSSSRTHVFVPSTTTGHYNDHRY